MHNLPFQRVIALVDMDCFYCQVEARLNPSLKGKPVAVVQYNQWKGGGIIAVNYEARDRGVARSMRGDEAKEKCPDIVLVSVPTVRGKADLSNYRDAGNEVAKIFSDFSDCVQRASIDEAYLDLTKPVEEYMKNNKDLELDDLKNTFVVGHCNLKSKNEDERIKGLGDWLKLAESDVNLDNRNYRLAIGGIIVEKMRSKILEKTGFHCSAGIAHNKILAKLTAGLHKPNKQTILPHDSVPELYENLPIYKVRNLGGKLGKQVSEKLSITYMSELYKFSLQELQQKFEEKTSSWLYNIARGIDLDPVTTRLMPESIGCCKNFTGLNKLVKKSEVQHWVRELATEVSERLHKDLEANKRRAKLLTVSFHQKAPMTRCTALHSYDVNKIVNDAMELLNKFNSSSTESDLWEPPIKCLGISASKFTGELTSIQKFLKTCSKDENTEKNGSDNFTWKKTETRELNCLEKLAETRSKSECRTEKSLDDFCSREVKPEKSNAVENSNANKSKSNRSFFLKFISQKKVETTESSSASKTDKIDETVNETEFISLSELIPDVKTAEKSVIDILPEPLKKKFNERLNSNDRCRNSIEIPSDKTEFDGETIREESVDSSQSFKTCNECGRNISLDIFLEHLDYHVALKLDSEINKTTERSGNGSSENNSSKQSNRENDNRGKRKRGGANDLNSKKMRSITSFFTVGPK